MWQPLTTDTFPKVCDLSRRKKITFPWTGLGQGPCPQETPWLPELSVVLSEMLPSLNHKVVAAGLNFGLTDTPELFFSCLSSGVDK